MKFVVKLGGASLEDKALLHSCGKAIAELARDGQSSGRRPRRRRAAHPHPRPNGQEERVHLRPPRSPTPKPAMPPSWCSPAA